MAKRLAKVISFINMKGGVAKTTLCREMANNISLQYYDNEEDRPLKVLLIDIDPQSNLTQALGERYNTEKLVGASIENIFNTKTTGYDLDKIIVKLNDNLDIVPGELKTIFLERAHNTTTAQKLLNFIEEHDLKDIYDYIFIDCPPTYSIYTEMAFFCSDYYLVPVIPDAFSALGVDLLERVVADIVYNNRRTIFRLHKPKSLGIIFTRVDKKQKPVQETHMSALPKADIVRKNELYIFKNQFTESNKISTSNFDKLINDRHDNALTNMLDEICSEFLDRIEELDKSEEGV